MVMADLRLMAPIMTIATRPPERLPRAAPWRLPAAWGERKVAEVFMYVCMYVCMSVCMSVCLFVCLSVCTFVCRCMYASAGCHFSAGMIHVHILWALQWHMHIYIAALH